MISRIFFAIGLLVAVVSSSNAAILVTEVMSNSAHPSDSTANDDWFELTNTGLVSMSIVGWSWVDGDPTHTTNVGFGSITSLAAGESVIITGEKKNTESSWRTDWNISSGVQVAALGGAFFGLHSDGDQVKIYDQNSALVTSVTFDAASTGFSFAWDNAGTYLGISSLGSNGAYKATFDGSNTALGPGVDVGSPGYVAPAAVPEPGTVAMLTAGLGVLLYGFRRRPFRRQ